MKRFKYFDTFYWNQDDWWIERLGHRQCAKLRVLKMWYFVGRLNMVMAECEESLLVEEESHFQVSLSTKIWQAIFYLLH